ncbi:MAG: hypothetical protein PHC51_12375 [bacterium]|nr:hypothetical protein [bacterium]
MLATAIVDLAVSAPSADNSQSWCFRIDSDTLVCSYRHRVVTPDPFGPLGHANLIACGALLENLDSLAIQRASPPKWIATPTSWQIVLERFQQFPEVPQAIVSRLLARHTNRHPFLQLGKHDLTRLPESPGSRAITIRESSAIKVLGDAIMHCSLARFDCQELHEWLFSSLRWSKQEIDSGTGLDINTLHLPPGGRRFMKWISPWPRMALLNRFGIGRVMAYADAALVRNAPGIIAIVSGNSAQETVDSGRLMQRIWLELNARGIAVHPYYVLTDQRNRRKSKKLDPKWHATIDSAIAMATEVLNLSPEEHIDMLMRIGRPSCLPVRSRRLPGSAFMDANAVIR